MTQIIAGLMVSLLTQGAKRLPGVPVDEGQKWRLRGVAVLLSVIATLFMAWNEGALALQNAIPIASESLSTFIYSVIAYYGLVR